jgi:peptide deformylase
MIISLDPSDLRAEQSPLRQVSISVRESGINPAPVIDRLLQELHSIPYGTGLSAIQVGIAVRIAVVNVRRRSGEDLILIDPVLLSVSGRLTTRREGCLSLPGFKGSVTRRNKVSLRAQDLNGLENLYHFSGYEAAVIQQELDHLDGILYWDRMSDEMKPLCLGVSPNDTV